MPLCFVGKMTSKAWRDSLTTVVLPVIELIVIFQSFFFLAPPSSGFSMPLAPLASHLHAHGKTVMQMNIYRVDKHGPSLYVINREVSSNQASAPSSSAPSAGPLRYTALIIVITEAQATCCFRWDPRRRAPASYIYGAVRIPAHHHLSGMSTTIVPACCPEFRTEGVPTHHHL